jgi:hypothetical protein
VESYRHAPFRYVRRVSSSTLAHVSASPPQIPDSRFSRIRLATLTFPKRPSQFHRGLSDNSHTPLMKLVYPLARHRSQVLQTNGRLYHFVPASLSACVRQDREPLCPLRALPFKGWRFPPPREALPPHHCSYGLMRQTKILLPTSLLPLFRKVLAGCR